MPINIVNLLSRVWLYFRVGHQTYLAFPLSFLQWMIVLYTLYIIQSPLATIFPRLSIFVFVFLSIYPLSAILVGYIHYKRSPMFKSEIEIGTEENPFIYKLIPNSKEAILQQYVILGAKINYRFYKEFGFFMEGEEEMWLEYTRLLEHLAKGGDIRTFKPTKEMKT